MRQRSDQFRDLFLTNDEGELLRIYAEYCLSFVGFTSMSKVLLGIFRKEPLPQDEHLRACRLYIFAALM